MRNSSHGAPLAPIPFDAIPGLEVTDLSPLEALVAEFRARHPEITEIWADRSNEIFHAMPAEPGLQTRQVLAFKQGGFWDWTLACAIFGCAVLAVAVSLYGAPDLTHIERDVILTDDIQACIAVGGEPVVRDLKVRCVPKAVQS